MLFAIAQGGGIEGSGLAANTLAVIRCTGFERNVSECFLSDDIGTDGSLEDFSAISCIGEVHVCVRVCGGQISMHTVVTWTDG